MVRILLADDEVEITRAYIEGTGGPVIRLRGQEVPRLEDMA